MRRSIDKLPRPYNLESKAIYLKRWLGDPEVRVAYSTPAKRAIMAEKAWLRAKGDSLVSIATTEGEFLLFGSVKQD